MGEASAAAGSLLQVVLGLGVVLVAVAASAWLAKRVGARSSGATGMVRVIGGAAVGPRERVVLVEVAGTWLVVGVAPGQVRALHSMAPAQLPPAAASAKTPPFAERLMRLMERRSAR